MTDKQTEALKLALAFIEHTAKYLPHAYDTPGLAVHTAIREALAEQPLTDTELINQGCRYQTELTQPAQQEPWADECRIELVNAIHFLASDFENALGAFGGDAEARRKAEGDIAHARRVASRWNWNGTTSPPASKPWVGLTDEERAGVYRSIPGNEFCVDAVAVATENKLREKNA